MNTNISEKQILTLANEYKKDIYPVVRPNGDFICFVQKSAYVDFVVRKKVTPGEYFEKNDPNIFDKTICSSDMQWMMDEELMKSYEAINDYSERYSHVATELDNQNEYVKEMKGKYPYEFFKTFYPY